MRCIFCSIVGLGGSNSYFRLANPCAASLISFMILSLWGILTTYYLPLGLGGLGVSSFTTFTLLVPSAWVGVFPLVSWCWTYSPSNSASILAEVSPKSWLSTLVPSSSWIFPFPLSFFSRISSIWTTSFSACFFLFKTYLSALWFCNWRLSHRVLLPLILLLWHILHWGLWYPYKDPFVHQGDQSLMQGGFGFPSFTFLIEISRECIMQ